MRFAYILWTRAVTDWIPQDVERIPGRPSKRCSDFFMKALNERYEALHVPQARRIHWSTLAHYRDGWRRCWRALEQVDDQRDDTRQVIL
ncbi:unnamed protein product [Heligmosomoides polygyrus]|uniref:Integrase n=1 Tax=Heligmosomoides polygyrus TaxID=6339 RepID=A0A183F5E0_HELPZ|nr:unnamed protein product [Heligmosomoides polygyrus]